MSTPRKTVLGNLGGSIRFMFSCIFKTMRASFYFIAFCFLALFLLVCPAYVFYMHFRDSPHVHLMNDGNGITTPPPTDMKLAFNDGRWSTLNNALYYVDAYYNETLRGKIILNEKIAALKVVVLNDARNHSLPDSVQAEWAAATAPLPGSESSKYLHKTGETSADVIQLYMDDKLTSGVVRFWEQQAIDTQVQIAAMHDRFMHIAQVARQVGVAGMDTEWVPHAGHEDPRFPSDN